MCWQSLSSTSSQYSLSTTTVTCEVMVRLSWNFDRRRLKTLTKNVSVMPRMWYRMNFLANLISHFGYFRFSFLLIIWYYSVEFLSYIFYFRLYDLNIAFCFYVIILILCLRNIKYRCYLVIFIFTFISW